MTEIKLLDESDLKEIEAVAARADSIVEDFYSSEHAIAATVGHVPVLIATIRSLQSERDRLTAEIAQPRCNDCDAVLGDNWCADCASKVFRVSLLSAIKDKAEEWAAVGDHCSGIEEARAYGMADAAEEIIKLVEEMGQ